MPSSINWNPVKKRIELTLEVGNQAQITISHLTGGTAVDIIDSATGQSIYLTESCNQQQNTTNINQPVQKTYYLYPTYISNLCISPHPLYDLQYPTYSERVQWDHGNYFRFIASGNELLVTVVTILPIGSTLG